MYNTTVAMVSISHTLLKEITEQVPILQQRGRGSAVQVTIALKRDHFTTIAAAAAKT